MNMSDPAYMASLKKALDEESAAEARLIAAYRNFLAAQRQEAAPLLLIEKARTFMTTALANGQNSATAANTEAEKFENATKKLLGQSNPAQ